MTPLSEESHGHLAPLYREGPVHALHILSNVDELLLPVRDGYDADKPLQKVIEDEWAAVPGRLAMDLTVDRLNPLAEVTEQFKELLFTESERSEVLGRAGRPVFREAT